MTRRALSVLLLASLAGCAAPPADGAPEDGLVVPSGKEDDFLSLSAAEFVISGRATVTLEAEYATMDEQARMDRVRELAGYQQVAIAWFLNQYLIEKHDEDGNEDYGGFGAMSRNNTYDSLDLQSDDGVTWSFYFEQIAAGRRDLISRMPTEPGPDGTRTFTLTIGTPTNAQLAQLETNHEWYRSSPWETWNPASVSDAQKTDLTLAIRPEVESQDAWFQYAAMMEDGLFDIDVHFGWDYHAAYHVSHARDVFAWLVRQGYEPPVATFEELDRESGPFVRTIEAGGREVRVEVRLFYGHEDDGPTDPDTAAGGIQLEQDMRESLRTRDVIMYSGHSGPFYGFALANWRTTDEGDLDDSEMRTVEMPANREQLVIAEGCDTYQIGEAFRNNPAKPGGAYIDVVTTTAPSNASTPAAVQDVISQLTRTNADGQHDPQPIRALLSDLDSNSRYFHTMYGVHGIDDDPQVHPWAVLENACSECAVDADCGGPGNRCVGVGTSGRHCAPSCTTDAGCGDGYLCRDVASASTRTVYDSVCVPSGLTCGG